MKSVREFSSCLIPFGAGFCLTQVGFWCPSAFQFGRLRRLGIGLAPCAFRPLCFCRPSLFLRTSFTQQKTDFTNFSALILGVFIKLENCIWIKSEILWYYHCCYFTTSTTTPASPPALCVAFAQDLGDTNTHYCQMPMMWVWVWVWVCVCVCVFDCVHKFHIPLCLRGMWKRRSKRRK